MSTHVVYLNKRWYRTSELARITGIARAFWRPYKKRGGIWISRKLGTHPTAPVCLHVESVADELDRRRFPYVVNIGGREVDPGMVGYRHTPPIIRRPSSRFEPGRTGVPVWDTLASARRLLARLVEAERSCLTEECSRAEEDLAFELTLFQLESERLHRRINTLKVAIEMLSGRA